MFCMWLECIQVADLRGAPPASAPTPHDPNFLNVMHFLEILVKLYVGAYLEGWRPLLWGIVDPLTYTIIEKGLSYTMHHHLQIILC